MKMFYFTISSVEVANALDVFDPFDNGSFSLDENSKTLKEDLIEFYEDCLDGILVDDNYLLDTISSEIKDSGFLNEYIRMRHDL
jgi:hypothetical protein